MMPNKLLSIEDQPIQIDRPRGFKKIFQTPRGPEEQTYPVDYGFFSNVINPDDDEELDVFVGSGGPNYGRFMKGKTLSGTWEPDEHKWYSGLTDDEYSQVTQFFTGQDPTLLRDYRKFKDVKEMLADVLTYGRLKKASSDLTSDKVTSQLAEIFKGFQIDKPKGTYKQFRDPSDPALKDYPIDGVTYPVNYGYLPGYVAEDEDDLDVFFGSGNQYGSMTVNRPDVAGGIERKLLYRVTPDELGAIEQAFNPVLSSKPEIINQRKFRDLLASYLQSKKVASDLILVSGHSGAGKSTLSQALTKKLNLPIHPIDNHPAFDHFIRNHPGRDELMTNEQARKDLHEVRRQAAIDTLAQAGDKGIVEGSQLGALTKEELSAYPKRVYVYTPLQRLLKQRMERVRLRRIAEGKPWNDEIASHRKRRAKEIYSIQNKSLQQFARLPGTIRYETRKNTPDEVISKLGRDNKHPLLARLLQAKQYSDQRDYGNKHHVLRQLITERPDEFMIDSEQGDIVGLTHKPTGFKIHAHRSVAAKLTTPKPADVYIIKGNPDVDRKNWDKYEAFYNQIKGLVEQQGMTADFDDGLAYTLPPGGKYWIGHSRGGDRLRFAPPGVKTLRLDDYEPPRAKELAQQQLQQLGREFGTDNWAGIPVEKRPTPTTDHYTVNPEMSKAIQHLLTKQAATTKKLSNDGSRGMTPADFAAKRVEFANSELGKLRTNALEFAGKSPVPADIGRFDYLPNPVSQSSYPLPASLEQALMRGTLDLMGDSGVNATVRRSYIPAGQNPLELIGMSNALPAPQSSIGLTDAKRQGMSHLHLLEAFRKKKEIAETKRELADMLTAINALTPKVRPGGVVGEFKRLGDRAMGKNHASGADIEKIKDLTDLSSRWQQKLESQTSDYNAALATSRRVLDPGDSAKAIRDIPGSNTAGTTPSFKSPSSSTNSGNFFSRNRTAIGIGAGIVGAGALAAGAYYMLNKRKKNQQAESGGKAEAGKSTDKDKEKDKDKDKPAAESKKAAIHKLARLMATSAK